MESPQKRDPHEHQWRWVETELGGAWGSAGTKHYDCACGTWKIVHPDGSEEILEIEPCEPTD